MNLNKIPAHTIGLYSLIVLFASLTFSSALVNVSFVVALIFWVISCPYKRFLDILPRKILVTIALFVGFATLSVVFSEVPATSLRGVEKLAKQIFLFFMTADFLARDLALRKYEKIAHIWLTVVLVNALMQLWLGHDLLRWAAPEASGAGVRLSASFGTYGKFAAFLVLVIPYSFSFFFQYKKSGKIALSTASFLLSLGLVTLLFLTKSRGAMLAFILGSLIALIALRKFKWILAVCCLTSLVLCLAPRNMIIHLDADKKEQSVVERFYLWDRAIHVIKAKPLFGTGLNTYAATHAKYDKTNNWRVRNYYAHNGYLQMAAETGLPCMISFLLFLGVFFYTGITCLNRGNCQMIDQQKGLLTGLFSFLLFAFVDTPLHNPQPVLTFWFFLGLVAAYWRRPSTIKS